MQQSFGSAKLQQQQHLQHKFAAPLRCQQQRGLPPLTSPAAAAAAFRTCIASSRQCSVSRSARLKVEAGKRAAATAAVSAAAPAASTVLLQPEVAFSCGTYLMVPIYFVLAFWPRSRLSRALLATPVLPLLFAAAYAVLAWQAWQCGSLSLVQTVIQSSQPWPDAALLAGLFQDKALAALAWLHLLMLDFLTARAVLLDGMRLLVPTAHSVLLCFMVGPLGLLSHLVTRVLVHWRRKDSPATASSSMWS